MGTRLGHGLHDLLEVSQKASLYKSGANWARNDLLDLVLGINRRLNLEHLMN